MSGSNSIDPPASLPMIRTHSQIKPETYSTDLAKDSSTANI